MCHNILKDSENTSQVIVADRDASTINYIAKIFPISHDLLCIYHLTKMCEVESMEVLEIKKSRVKTRK